MSDFFHPGADAWRNEAWEVTRERDNLNTHDAVFCRCATRSCSTVRPTRSYEPLSPPPISRKFHVMEKLALRRLMIGVSLILFVVSLTQDAFYEEGNNEAAHALPLFALGWMGFLDGKIAWFANPALFASWLRKLDSKGPFNSLTCSGLAICLALSFLLHDQISAQGRPRAIVGYGLGYWLWVSSIATTVIGNLAMLRAKQKESPGQRATKP
ncbi:MAG: hypothetical protein ACI8P0_002133 [Planctomycetaceae bacterium]|jgi:hypothetical protein